MKQQTKKVAKRTTTIIALRECAVSSPANLARNLNIPSSTARNRIKKLEEEGIVTGYTPIVTPQTFGEPYLVKIDIDTSQYQYPEDLQDTITNLINHLQASIGHAPISFYIIKDKTGGVLHIHCITMTYDIDAVIDSIYREQNIAKENITASKLEAAYGIPNYGRFSLPKPSTTPSKTKARRGDKDK